MPNFDPNDNESQQALQSYARFQAEAAGTDPDRFVKKITQESSWNPSAVSPAGARGLGQFIPDTGKKYGLNTPADHHDPFKSLTASAQHTADLEKQYGDPVTALVGYNGSPKVVARYQRGGLANVPKETRNYVNKIEGNRAPQRISQSAPAAAEDPEDTYAKFRAEVDGPSAAPEQAPAVPQSSTVDPPNSSGPRPLSMGQSSAPRRISSTSTTKTDAGWDKIIAEQGRQASTPARISTPREPVDTRRSSASYQQAHRSPSAFEGASVSGSIGDQVAQPEPRISQQPILNRDQPAPRIGAALPQQPADNGISKLSLGLETAFNEARANADKPEMERYGRMLQKEGWEAGPGDDGWWYVKPPTGQQRQASQGTEAFVEAQRPKAPTARKRIPYMPGPLAGLPDSAKQALVDLGTPAVEAAGRIATGISRVPATAYQWGKDLPRRLGYDPPPVGGEIRDDASGPAGNPIGQAGQKLTEETARISQEYGLPAGKAKQLVRGIGAAAPLLLLRTPTAMGLAGAAESAGEGDDLLSAAAKGIEQGVAIKGMGLAAHGLDEVLPGLDRISQAARMGGRTAANALLPTATSAAFQPLTGAPVTTPSLERLPFDVGFAAMHGNGMARENDRISKQRAANTDAASRATDAATQHITQMQELARQNIAQADVAERIGVPKQVRAADLIMRARQASGLENAGIPQISPPPPEPPDGPRSGAQDAADYQMQRIADEQGRAPAQTADELAQRQHTPIAYGPDERAAYEQQRATQERTSPEGQLPDLPRLVKRPEPPTESALDQRVSDHLAKHPNDTAGEIAKAVGVEGKPLRESLTRLRARVEGKTEARDERTTKVVTPDSRVVDGALAVRAGDARAGEAVKEETQAGSGGLEKSGPDRQFSSTQVNLPPTTAKKVTDLAAKIPDSALAEDGREANPHVTVKFGGHGNDPAEMAKVLEGEPPIKVKLGKTSVFAAKEGAPYDVVKADVDSPDLHRLNKKIAEALPHTDTHPEYKPHVTLAYVKPGEGTNYAGDSTLEGHEVKLDHVTFSGKDRKETDIPLTGAEQELEKFKSAESDADVMALEARAKFRSKENKEELSKFKKAEIAAEKMAVVARKRFLDEEHTALNKSERESRLKAIGIDSKIDQVKIGKALDDPNWSDALDKVHAPDKEPTKQDIANFRTLSNGIGITGKSIKRILDSGTARRAKETLGQSDSGEIVSTAGGKPRGRTGQEGAPESSSGKQVDAVEAKSERSMLVDGDKVTASLTPEQAAKFDSLDAAHKQLRKNIAARVEAGTVGRGDAAVRIKGDAMRTAAEKRAVHPDFATGKEAVASAKREAGNYIGKEVEVDGKPGKVVANPFGKVKVEFADGKTKIVAKDAVSARSERPAVEPRISDTPKPEAKSAGSDKEPWQITRRAFTERQLPWFEPHSEAYHEGLKGFDEYDAGSKRKWRGNRAPDHTYAGEQSDVLGDGQTQVRIRFAQHREAVEAALSEGKSVSPEVLADYPDLAAKSAPVEVTVGIQQAFQDWKRNEAYLDNGGNYRLKASFEDGTRARMAPWNKEIKAAFADNEAFHKAAQKAPLIEKPPAEPEPLTKEGAKVARIDEKMDALLELPDTPENHAEHKRLQGLRNAARAAEDAAKEAAKAAPKPTRLALKAKAQKEAREAAKAKPVEPAPRIEAKRATPKEPTAMSDLQDVGEKIGGARKDRWAERGLTVKDLEGMTGGEESAYVTKANIWKPDYAKMVAEGADPHAVALAKVVYDKLGAKPRLDTPEGRRLYLEMMGHVKDVYSGIKTVEDVKAARHTLYNDKLGWGGDMKDQKRDVAFSVYKGRSAPFDVGYAERQRASKLVAEGFPAQEPWTRRFTVQKDSQGAGLTDAGADYYAKKAFASDDPWTEQFKSEAELTAKFKTEGVYAVREKASNKALSFRLDEASARARAEELYGIKKAKPEGGETPERPHLDRLVREGEDLRQGRDIDPEDFRQQFGFRGVEFGNWAASDERQTHVNQAHDALTDLAGALQIQPKSLSLDGTLGLAFGARGSRFRAHYESSKVVINLAKKTGPGALAHEWGHAIDHYFGELDQPDAYKAVARGASGWYKKDTYTGEAKTRTVKQADGTWKDVQQQRLKNLRPDVSKAFDGVMDALFSRNKTKAEAVRATELQLEGIQTQLADYTKRMESAKAEPVEKQNRKWMREGADWINTLQRRAEINGRKLTELNGEEKPEGGYGSVESSYSKSATKLSGPSGDYWKRPTEMFARSFEAYVHDKLDRKSEYLVHGTEGDRFSEDKGYKGNPYPEGVERATINKAFDRLFMKLREHELRADLKDQISTETRKLLNQTNIGVPTELLGLYTKLGASYVREGVQDLTEFVKRLKSDLGDVKYKLMVDHVGGIPKLWRESQREVEGTRSEVGDQASFDGREKPAAAPDASMPKIVGRKIGVEAAPSNVTENRSPEVEKGVTPTAAPEANVIAKSSDIPEPVGDVVRRIHGTSAKNVDAIFSEGLNYKRGMFSTTASADGQDLRRYSKYQGRAAGPEDATIIADIPKAEFRKHDQAAGEGQGDLLAGAIPPEHITGAVVNGEFRPNPAYKGETTPEQGQHHSAYQPREEGQFAGSPEFPKGDARAEASAEPDTPESRSLGIKKSEVARERSARLADPIEKEASKSMGISYDNGREMVLRDDAYRDKVADLAKNPRPLSDEEVGALVFDRRRLSDEHRGLMDQIEKAQNEGDESAETSARIALARTEDQINDSEMASSRAGTRMGRGLSAMRMMVKADYTLDRLVQRARVAGSAEVRPELHAKLENLTKQLDVQTARADLYETKASEQASKQAFRKLEAQARQESRKEKRAVTKGNLDDEFATLKDQLADARKEAQKISPSGLASLDPEGKITPIVLKMARNRVKAGANSAEGLVDSIYQAVKDHIEGVTPRDIRDAISGYGSAPKTRNQTVSEMTRIRAELRKVSKAEDSPAAAPKVQAPRRIEKTPASIYADKLAATKKRLTNQLANLQNKLDTGDFSKPDARVPLVLDPEAQRLKADVVRTKKAIDAQIKKLELANESSPAKVARFMVKARRAIVLSGVTTVGKLGAAASGRVALSAIEEGIGAGLGKLPFIRGVAAKAPREGGASIEAEKAALSHTFSADARKAAKDTISTGASDLDVLYGGKEQHEPELIEIFGRIHGALKTPASQNEFYRSITKRSAFERRKVTSEGMRPDQIDEHMNSPVTQARLGAEAYKDSQRAKMMNDNGMVAIYRGVLSAMGRVGGEGDFGRAMGKVVKFGADMELPVVKIPTNFIGESSSYVFGGLKALGQALYVGGSKNMTPDQADYVMRNLKKQTLGAVMALAFASVPGIEAGGYYQEGDNKDEKKPKSGHLRLFGYDIPGWMAHIPALEPLQVAATFANVYKKAAQKGTSKLGATGAGVLASGVGMLKEVPFIDQPIRMMESLKNWQGATKAAGEHVAGFITPPDVRKVAGMIDQPSGNVFERIAGEPTKRKPKGFLEPIEMGIPGLRQRVGESDSPRIGGGGSRYGKQGGDASQYGKHGYGNQYGKQK